MKRTSGQTVETMWQNVFLHTQKKSLSLSLLPQLSIRQHLCYFLRPSRFSFQARPQICEERLSASSCMSVRPHGAQIDSRWTDFDQILYSGFFTKPVAEIQV
jgi:hypothetical protein